MGARSITSAHDEEDKKKVENPEDGRSPGRMERGRERERQRERETLLRDVNVNRLSNLPSSIL